MRNLLKSKVGKRKDKKMRPRNKFYQKREMLLKRQGREE